MVNSDFNEWITRFCEVNLGTPPKGIEPVQIGSPVLKNSFGVQLGAAAGATVFYVGKIKGYYILPSPRLGNGHPSYAQIKFEGAMVAEFGCVNVLMSQLLFQQATGMDNPQKPFPSYFPDFAIIPIEFDFIVFDEFDYQENNILSSDSSWCQVLFTGYKITV